MGTLDNAEVEADEDEDFCLENGGAFVVAGRDPNEEKEQDEYCCNSAVCDTWRHASPHSVPRAPCTPGLPISSKGEADKGLEMEDWLLLYHSRDELSRKRQAPSISYTLTSGSLELKEASAENSKVETSESLKQVPLLEAEEATGLDRNLGTASFAFKVKS